MHAPLSHLVYLVLALRLGVVIANDGIRVCNAWGRISALLLYWEPHTVVSPLACVYLQRVGSMLMECKRTAFVCDDAWLRCSRRGLEPCKDEATMS
jgi:hypothetical protein